MLFLTEVIWESPPSGDFHSQNILIVDADTSPRISGVIDWEFSSTDGTSSFSTYPLFIVDNPMWEHPLRTRNVRDRATFISPMREAERKMDPKGLSQSASANCSPQISSLLFCFIRAQTRIGTVDNRAQRISDHSRCFNTLVITQQQ